MIGSIFRPVLDEQCFFLLFYPFNEKYLFSKLAKKSLLFSRINLK